MKKWLMLGVGGLVLVALWSFSTRPAEAAPLSGTGRVSVVMRSGAWPLAQPISWSSGPALWLRPLDPLPKLSLICWPRRSRRRGGGSRHRRSRHRGRHRRRRVRSGQGRVTLLVAKRKEATGASWWESTSPQPMKEGQASGARPDQVTGVSSVGGVVAASTVEAAGLDKARPEDMVLSAWVTQELAAVSLGDRRLDRRLHTLVEQFAQQPTASIPQACGSWAPAKAAYRFFDNSRVSHGVILAGHRQACLERVADEEIILALQDTTSLDYTHHPRTQDLGPLENPDCQGMFVHSALAVSDAGVPLGLLDQQVWTRDPEAVGQRHQRKKRPIEEKESFKWLKGLRASLKGLPAQVCLVTVADREADIFDFFLDAETHETQVLVRAAWNRRLTDPPGYLWDQVARTSVRGRFTVEVGRAKDRLPREATVAVRFTPVTVRPPRHRLHEPGLYPLPLYAIEVREEDPPPGVEPLHWLLLTNRAVQSLNEAQRCVRWYGLRWLVERYHFVLKSGCRIEERQFETAERLKRCLGVYAIVAWRLLWLTYQARITPEAPCTVALETHEWQALYCYIHRTSILPAEPPSLNQAVRWIAQLGGFLGRTHDDEPGVKVLWRGWQRLHDITETWLLIHPPPDVGNA